MNIAFLGIGLMGAPMARRLSRAGHALKAWNRTRSKAAALEDEGVLVAETPAEAVAASEVVVSILENAAAVEAVLFDRATLDAARAGTLFIDMSSIAPEKARTHAARLEARGLAHLDAPVSGGPGGAAEGTLAIMAGGRPADFERAEPLLEAMGRPTLVGASGAGQFAKLTSQMIASAALAAVAEALLLARCEGVDPLRIRDALAGGFADSKILQVHGKRMVARDFVPGGHVRTFVKDLLAARSIAASRGLELPVTALAFDLFGSLVTRGASDLDIAAVALEIEARNPPHSIGVGRDTSLTNPS